MNLIWRVIWIIFISRFATKINFLAESSIHLRVLPTDVDLLWHMNNGRYLSVLDLGRINHLIRCNLYSIFRKQNIYAVVASETIRFKSSLKLLQKYTIRTQIIGWDDKFFYIRHLFVREKELYAMSIVKIRILSRSLKQGLPPQAVFAKTNLEFPSPPLPEWVKSWNQFDQAFYAEAMQATHPDLRVKQD